MNRYNIPALGAAIVLALTLAACGSAAMPVAHTAAPASSPAATATTTPPATPNPEGTYQFSGDYTLGEPQNDGTMSALLVGEVDVTNTGNIGTVDRITFGWPQEGYPAITVAKTVHVASGATKAVGFHYPIADVNGNNIIDLLQAWQSGHGYKDGYTAKVTIVRTYGQVSG